eukprot:CAMPEP_0119129772 /NCGR_PEP_ID=MMETSP1310-20130426/7377_1 /TAXON_ID=464262 /ORGANISM="Genus nov. species nov., Strain RCC2339" /LENGTH=673 /DNA_ID=CAMNT_0007120215 /DNA_START=128 /DNA_END=2146 /DNA_ORIENTATION=+
MKLIHRTRSVLWPVLAIVSRYVFVVIGSDVSGEQFREWGDEISTIIFKDFSLPNSSLFAHSLDDQWPDFAWGQGVQFRSLCAAARVDPLSYLSVTEQQAQEIRARYWCLHNGIWGFTAAVDSCGDRYYDDNAWLALAFLELYDLTLNVRYLQWAEETVVFCMSGENGPQDDPDGGIRWHEGDQSGASVCSTAPTIVANLHIYAITGTASYYNDAERLYYWIMASDLRYDTWLFHETAQGPLGYQTAVMSQAALRMYLSSGNTSHLLEAQNMATSMETSFVDARSHVLHSTGKWGGHDMTTAYAALYAVDGNPRWLDIISGYLGYLHDVARDGTSGRYPDSWDDAASGGERDLMSNACAARGFWDVAYTHGGSAPEYPVVLFEDCQYGGWSAGFEPGTYCLSDLRAHGVGDNDVSSVTIAPGYSVTFFSGDHLADSSLSKSVDDDCLVDDNFNDVVSSMVITSTTNVPAGPAWSPRPAVSARGVSLRADLFWTGGSGAVSHCLFFGTDPSPPYLGEYTTTVYNPGQLEPNTTYYWSVAERNFFGTTTNGTVWSFATSPFVGFGTGLFGYYFDNADLTNLVLARTDPSVDFDWTMGSPDPSVSPDTFSVRWVGYVQPQYSEIYSFFTTTDDGARLWVGGRLLVDAWVDQGPVEHFGNISLTAFQKYDLTFEYYEN